MTAWPSSRAEIDALAQRFARMPSKERVALVSDPTLPNEIATKLFAAIVYGATEANEATESEVGLVAIAMAANPNFGMDTLARLVRDCFDQEAWIDDQQRPQLLTAFAENPVLPLLELMGEVQHNHRVAAMLQSVRRQIPRGQNRGRFGLGAPRDEDADLFWTEVDRLLEAYSPRLDVSVERTGVDAIRSWGSVKFSLESTQSQAHMAFAQVNRLPSRYYQSVSVEGNAIELLFLAVMQRYFNEGIYLRSWNVPAFWRFVEPLSPYKAPGWFWADGRILTR